MSRAFVKEPEGDNVVLDRPLRQHSDLPNYITARGLEVLGQKIAELESQRNTCAGEKERLGKKADLQAMNEDLSFYRERLERAIVVATPEPPWERVEFGACLELLDENSNTHHFCIVGEDEIDVAAGRISWSSPLGRAVMGKAVGDVEIWQRPAGDLEIEIVTINYQG